LIACSPTGGRAQQREKSEKFTTLTHFFKDFHRGDFFQASHPPLFVVFLLKSLLFLKKRKQQKKPKPNNNNNAASYY
jgi:hypothetical protein